VRESKISLLQFTIIGNYPNSFNSYTTIIYEIDSPANVNLKIYDKLGSLVVTLVNEEQTPGRKEVRWDSRDKNGLSVSSGVYFVTLAVKTFTTTRKILLVQ
jgi:flagellar hook assembly protein FlgD